MMIPQSEGVSAPTQQGPLGLPGKEAEAALLPGQISGHFPFSHL